MPRYSVCKYKLSVKCARRNVTHFTGSLAQPAASSWPCRGSRPHISYLWNELAGQNNHVIDVNKEISSFWNGFLFSTVPLQSAITSSPGNKAPMTYLSCSGHKQLFAKSTLLVKVHSLKKSNFRAVVAKSCLAKRPAVDQLWGRVCRSLVHRHVASTLSKSWCTSIHTTNYKLDVLHGAIAFNDSTQHRVWIAAVTTNAAGHLTKAPCRGGPTHIFPSLVDETHPIYRFISLSTSDVDRAGLAPLGKSECVKFEKSSPTYGR